MVVKFRDEEGYPAEIYGAGVTYSLLDKEYKAQHRPIRCKDFFQDMIWAEKTNQNASIYGFSWKPTGQILNQKHLMIGVKNDGKNIGDKAQNCQKLLNQLEKILKFPKSKCVADETGTAIVTTFSTKWTEVPYVFSFFTMMLRTGLSYNDEPLEVFYNEAGKNNSIPMNDRGYIKTAMPKITELLKGNIFKQDYDTYKSVSQVHNNSGVCNFKM